jgi:hypothetical protein
MQVVEAKERGAFAPTNSEAGVPLICRKFVSDHDLW